MPPSPGALAALHEEALRLVEQAADEDELWRVRIASLNGLNKLGSRDELGHDRDLCAAAAVYFERHQDWPSLFMALDTYATYALRLGAYEEVREASKRCLGWPHLPAWARGKAQFMMSDSYWVQGEYDACITTAQDALAQVRPGYPLEPLADAVGQAAVAAYCCGRWSELDRLQQTLALGWDELQEVPGMNAPWRWAGCMPFLLVALAREDHAAADAAVALLDRVVPLSNPDAQLRHLRHSIVAAHLADDPTRFDLDGLAQRPHLVSWVLVYFDEHGLPAPGWLIEAERNSGAAATDALADTAEALASGDNVRLAAAIDEAEVRHLIPHAARMRIVLAQQTGDPAPLERARPVLERLGDRQFLRRLEEVHGTLK